MSERLTDEKRQAILADYAAGMGYHAVARRHGVCAQTVVNHVRAAGVGRAREEAMSPAAARVLAAADAYVAKMDEIDALRERPQGHWSVIGKAETKALDLLAELRTAVAAWEEEQRA